MRIVADDPGTCWVLGSCRVASSPLTRRMVDGWPSGERRYYGCMQDSLTAVTPSFAITIVDEVYERSAARHGRGIARDGSALVPQRSSAPTALPAATVSCSCILSPRA